jgi:hypothetical protein
MDTDPPTFSEWVDYCFVHGSRDFAGRTEDDSDVTDERCVRFGGLDPRLLTEHLTRLFESPSFIAERYRSDQIAEATWFIFGSSGYMGTLRRGRVPVDAASRCIRSVATMYTDLFDKVCGKHGDEPDENLYNTVPIDIAVYMIWDMDGIQYIPTFPEKNPELVEPAIHVLETVLRRCITSSCLISALHGVGHLIGSRAHRGDHAMVTRLRGMIDEVARRRRLPDWLAEYASRARSGAVQ